MPTSGCQSAWSPLGRKRISERGTARSTLEYSFTPTGGSRILPTGRFVVFANLGTSWVQSSVVSGSTSHGTLNFGRILTRRTRADDDQIEVAFRTVGGSDILPTPNRFKSFDTMVINRWYNSSEIEFLIPLSASGPDDVAPGGAGEMLSGPAEGCVECLADGDMESSTASAAARR